MKVVDEIQLLDHGYVRLIEHWGSDERIIEPARMSTGKGFKGWGPYRLYRCLKCDATYTSEDFAGSTHLMCLRAPVDPKTLIIEPGHEMTWDEVPVGDEKLLTYLYSHKHMSPFEMAGMVVEVQAPIFVFREWHRHRTQCLVGDTDIALVTPTGTTFKRTIQEIYERKYGGVVDTAPDRHRNGVSKAGTPVTRVARRKDPWRVRILPNCQNRRMRVLNEKTMTFEIGDMKDVVESGIKEVYEVRTKTRRIRASADHRFYTTSGWKTVAQLVSGDVRIARMGREQPQASVLDVSSREDRWEDVVSVRAVGKAMTYDIVMEGPHHNFVANDLVVHNSYNEMSARYTPLPDMNYMPTTERLLANGGANKQAGSTGQSLSPTMAMWFRDTLAAAYHDDENVYQAALYEGVPKELARLVLPVARYSRMRASTNLRCWLMFLTLRCDTAAQWEIRQYADAVSVLIAQLFPRTHGLWVAGSSS